LAPKHLTVPVASRTHWELLPIDTSTAVVMDDTGCA
jgi:hypothetical protein